MVPTASESASRRADSSTGSALSLMYATLIGAFGRRLAPSDGPPGARSECFKAVGTLQRMNVQQVHVSGTGATGLHCGPVITEPQVYGMCLFYHVCQMSVQWSVGPRECVLMCAKHPLCILVYLLIFCEFGI